MIKAILRDFLYLFIFQLIAQMFMWLLNEKWWITVVCFSMGYIAGRIYETVFDD